ncbi:aromatic amino acid lyase [Lentzea sp. NPDC059081]|uniref:aromatic amino acid lyase n=1 Tax=Lentzea sp. NPDC059081 TaxID=3346719 RepID=UPI0036CD4D83
MTVELNGESLTLAEVAAVSVRGDTAVLSEGSMTAMRASQELKDKLLRDGQTIYGVSTGFGDSVVRQVAPVKAAELQRNLIRYHVNGTGPDAPAEVVRATLLVRANCLARGNSGIRPEVVSRLLWHLDNDALPRVPERGSVGASGDLVPLCYVASALIGEGQVRHGGEVLHTRDFLAARDLAPIELEAKEGLALINGTSFSSAFAAMAVLRAGEIVRLAELCTAMTSEAVLGNRGHFAPFIHEAKPHPGQVSSAAAIFRLLTGSSLAMDHHEVEALTGGLGGDEYRRLNRSVQDRYSIRCAPHVIGVLRDTLDWTRTWVETEINSTNDNPLFDVGSGTVHSGGNFYGGHIAQAMDSLKTATANIADLLDRQLEHVVDEKFNNGLTPNLIPDFDPHEWRAGLHHGFKGMQIACSAITAEALNQSTPAGIFSRSTEAHNQDKVSMSAIAARDALRVVELVEEVVAIHLLALCQALELRGVEDASPLTRRAFALVRDHVTTVHDDRAMDGDIAAVLALVRSGELPGVLS